MQVNREFSPRVAELLKRVDDDTLELILTNATQMEPVEIPGWQRREIEDAERSMVQGNEISFEEVKKKMLRRAAPNNEIST